MPDDGPAPLVGVDALSPSAAAVRDARAPRIVHLGLGAFHRSHQAWFTQRSASRPGEAPWGITAFTGRRPDAAVALARQGGVYTVIERSATGDTAELIDVIVAAHDGAAATDWRTAFQDSRTAVVTLTVTEPAYRRTPRGDVDLDHPDVAHDVALLRGAASSASGMAACISAPGRLVDGLRARRAAGGGPIAIVSCDNLTANGEVTRDVVVSLAAAVDAGLARWILDSVSFVSSMVDRITPATTESDRQDARHLTGYDDRAVVVAEPFAEWVLSGSFPLGRPAWETAGARFVDDLEPYEHRKLWLLNAGHSLLAYLGLLLGHETIDEAMADPRCTAPLEQLWDEAAEALPLPPDEVDAARAALRERFRNPRIRHRLEQIAADGSVKLPVRIVEPVRLRLGASSSASAGIGPGAAVALAAWQLHLARQGDLVHDDGAAALGAAPTVLDVLRAIAPDLASRPEVVAAVEAAADRILSSLTTPAPHQGVPA